LIALCEWIMVNTQWSISERALCQNFKPLFHLIWTLLCGPFFSSITKMDHSELWRF
jgi:hypothetical protein